MNFMGDAIISRTSKNSDVNIVQETGTSTTNIISQKGCTDSFAAKKHEHSAEDIVSGVTSIDNGGTGATTADDARINLEVPANKTINQQMTDFNSYTEVGFYSLHNPLYNVPDTSMSGNYSYSLIVAHGVFKNGTNDIDQIAVSENGDMYLRHYSRSFNTWYSWQRINNTSVKPLEVTKGGTGANNTSSARENLGLGKLATKNNIDFSESDQYTGILGMQSGGTGASTAEQARKNLNVPYLPSSYYEGDLNNLTDTGFYTINDRGTTNAPPTIQFTPSWLLMVISSKTTSLNVGTFQICSEIFATKKTSVWVRKCDGTSDWTDWENINYNSDTNLVRSISENLELYISPSGDDMAGDGSSSSPYATMKKALSLLSGKMINSVVSIYVMEGTYDESLDLIGLYGSGNVRILGYSLGRGSFKSCRIDDNTLRMLEIHDMDIGSGTMYVRENLCYINLCGINFTGTSISLSTSNVMISRCNFSNATTAINAYPRGGAGGRGYDGIGKVVLKDVNTFEGVTTAVSVSGGCMLIQSTLPTLNGATLKKSTGGMIVYPNGTFSED